MTIYEPNFNNKAFRRRSILALQFVSRVSSKLNKPTWLSCRWIHNKDNLGQAQNPTSKYLKELLLICVDDRYSYAPNNKDCKKYIRNKDGVKFLTEQLGLNETPTYYKTIFDKPEIKQQIQSGQFIYKDSSSRLHHPLQSVPRELKQTELAKEGYIYQYDVECCAPTLIYQYAQHCGMDEYLFAINGYLKDRSSIRNRIANECEISQGQIKVIINALFQGGILRDNKHHQDSIYKDLDGDSARIQWLQQDQFLTELRNDIKKCWEYITPEMNKTSKRTRINKKGVECLVPVNGKRKTGLYRDLERQVMNVVWDYLERNEIRHIKEHDGWTSDKEIDIEQVIIEIKEKTGFSLRFDMNKV
jgi:predicted transcriptional regulator